MKFGPYPKYKDSGVEWLGDVPEHWTVAALAYRYEVALGKMLDGKQIVGDHLAPYLRNVDVQWNRVNTADLPEMDFSPSDRCRFSLRPDDLLVCEGGDVGRAAIWSGQLNECYYQKALHRLRAHKTARDIGRFMLYVFWDSALKGRFTACEGRSTIAHLTAETLRRYLFAFPPKHEQAQVALYLDRETAKIDTLIAKQERLIELLQEKLQALISHAVTKGINPDATMRPSGVGWLGDTPAHWNLVGLSRITLEKCDGPFGSGLKSEHYKEDGVRVIRLQNIRSGWFDDTDKAYIDTDYFKSEFQRHEVQAGDLLIAGLGDDNHTVGRCCVAPDGVYPAMVKADCFRFRLDAQKGIPQFFAFQLTAGAAFDAGMLVTGSTRSRIALSTMASRVVAVPPCTEQCSIVNFINVRLGNTDTVIEKARLSIALLRERRSALISTAVTGKIDVREPAYA